MKIVVTGGAGFIASHVVDSYIAAGHQVVIIDNLSTGREENINPAAAFYRMDIRDEGVGDIFTKEKVEVVNHHAAQMDVRKSVEDPRFDADVNIGGTINLLEQCKQHGVKRFVFASTGGAIYGEQDIFPADEGHPERPLSPYGISKLACEKYLFYYKEVHGLEYVVLRYANVYGPRQNPHGEAGVVAIFTERMVAGEEPLINGDGGQTRDYVYVGDVVEANGLALTTRENGTFNIGTSLETDVNTLFRRLVTLTEARCSEKHGPAMEGEQRRSVIDWRRAEATLGWSPKVPLEQGLAATVRYFNKD
ncbi:MAG: NAD-dependent epimerase/dehydratase family protein [Deltaproteobacteria bacterium]|nr:NAD-dependent epimerase/dehydratase family protein [Deltaproteobacteria bacterium]